VCLTRVKMHVSNCLTHVQCRTRVKMHVAICSIFVVCEAHCSNMPLIWKVEFIPKSVVSFAFQVGSIVGFSSWAFEQGHDGSNNLLSGARFDGIINSSNCRQIFGFLDHFYSRAFKPCIFGGSNDIVLDCTINS